MFFYEENNINSVPTRTQILRIVFYMQIYYAILYPGYTDINVRTKCIDHNQE